MNNFEINGVAKGGGTTMAQPRLFAERIAQPGNEADILVVSAPGINLERGHTVRMTERLAVYEQRPTVTGAEAIQTQLAEVAATMDPAGANEEIQAVIGGVQSDLQRWRRDGAPLKALGEQWSAQMFAAYTGREYVDARRLIRFDRDGRLDLATTRTAIRRELGGGRGGQYVVPGFYGADVGGRIHLLPPGGSDLTGALLAGALGAGSYYIWSDRPGVMSADPEQVPAAQLIPELTHRETRELDCQIVHPDVLRYARRQSIYLHNTFGASAEAGTIIRPTRDWSDRPLAGLRGKAGLGLLALHEFGMNAQVGATTDVFELLRDRGIPYEHIATSIDGLSLTLPEEEHLDQLPHRLFGPEHLDRHARLGRVGLLRLVGEGLAQPGSVRGQAHERLARALNRQGIPILGSTGEPFSTSLMFLVESEAVVDGLRAAHAELFED